MARFYLACLALLLPGWAAAQESPFRFDASLRIDLHHTGDATSESFSLDELRLEGAWPGSREQLVDRSGQGCTLAEVYAPGGQQPIFSQGYCSLFWEWQTTGEAKRVRRTLSETVRLPWPRGKVRLVMKSRDRRNRLRRVFETTIDPDSLQVSREQRRGGLRVLSLHRGGAVERCLDIVLLGDGYQSWQMDKFRQDARRFSAVLLSAAPFAEQKANLNVWAVESPSRQSGVDEPRKGVFRDTALSMSFNTFGSSRYLMTADHKAVRDVAANAPYDTVIIIANTSRYGGGGIYNFYASFVSDNEYDEYTLVHEFGHSLGALGDEYFTSSTAYNEMYPRGVEPWEPNITGERRRHRIKWRDLIEKETPVPTPAQEPRYRDRVGLFEGAGYSAKGLYRPAVDCKMFDKGHKPFCPVCLKAVAGAISRYTR